METEKTSKRKTYPQKWHEYNEAQTKEKLMFYKLLDELLNVIPEQAYTFGRPKKSFRDMFFCCMTKTYANTSARRTISELELVKRAGYISEVCHFNTLLNYFGETRMKYVLDYLITLSALPLKNVEDTFAIDATGFGTKRFDRWVHDKYEVKSIDQGKFVKAHVTCGTKTNIVIKAEITPGNVHDNTQFEDLFKATALNFNITDFCADKGYLARDNMKLVDEYGATLYVPFKKGSTAKRRGSPTWNRMFKEFTLNRFEFDRHYHRRSNVETTFSMIKGKFGEFCKSKYMLTQTNEILCKILAHNITCLIHEVLELKIDIDFPACEKLIISNPAQ